MSQRRRGNPTIFMIVAAIIALNIFGSGVIPILVFGGIVFCFGLAVTTKGERHAVLFIFIFYFI